MRKGSYRGSMRLTCVCAVNVQQSAPRAHCWLPTACIKDPELLPCCAALPCLTKTHTAEPVRTRARQHIAAALHHRVDRLLIALRVDARNEAQQS